jgi:hypothetical protein
MPRDRFTDLFTAAERDEIFEDACVIADDPTLRVNSDGTPVRGIGHWEEMRLDQRQCFVDDDHADALDGIGRAEAKASPAARPESVVRFQVEARAVSGRSLPDRVSGEEMPVLSVVSTLDDARTWAAETFEADDRVVIVLVRETVAQKCPRGRFGRHVEIVKRPA